MSSIKGDIQELERINAEIKRMSIHVKALRKQAKVVEDRIVEFLNVKNQPGVKYDEKAIMVENKTKRGPKKVVDRENDSLRILQDYGIENPKKVLDEILEARKGSEEEIKKLKIKKIK